MLDKSDCWRELAERSILRYREIEEASGVNFYHEVGFLSLIDDQYKDTEKLQRALAKLESLLSFVLYHNQLSRNLTPKVRNCLLIMNLLIQLLFCILSKSNNM